VIASKADEDLIEIYEGETTACELVVAANLANRGRTFSLQFYDEDSEEWVTEASAKAGSKGSSDSAVRRYLDSR